VFLLQWLGGRGGSGYQILCLVFFFPMTVSFSSLAFWSMVGWLISSTNAHSIVIVVDPKAHHSSFNDD